MHREINDFHFSCNVFLLSVNIFASSNEEGNGFKLAANIITSKLLPSEITSNQAEKIFYKYIFLHEIFHFARDKLKKIKPLHKINTTSLAVICKCAT